MRIYFSHPMTTYGTQLERVALKAIQERFPEALIDNPANYPSKAMDCYLERVRAADVVVFTTTVRRSIGKGVLQELQEARLQEKEVWFYDPVKQAFFQNFTIEELSETSWKRYAKIQTEE
ncbi:MAG: hypothetical protein ACFFB3_15200 [Candidatus Hodarchaeota archaeon]